MRLTLCLCLIVLVMACERLPPVPNVTEPQPFRATTEAWSGTELTITSPAFANATELPPVLLDAAPLNVSRVDDTTLRARVPDVPGQHVLRVVSSDVVPSPVTVYLRGFIGRTEGPLLSGRVEPGRDPRHVYGSGPTTLRRWNIATNKEVDFDDTVHAVSCTRGVGPGPNVGELALLTGGCDGGTWMLWNTGPLTPLNDTTSAPAADFVAVLRSGRWIVLDAGVFSLVACDSATTCATETVAGFVGTDVVRSPSGDRAALVGRPPDGATASGIPIVAVSSATVAYRSLELSTATAAVFSGLGDTLFLVGDAAGVARLAAVRASDGQRYASRQLEYVPCAVAIDTVRPWLFVAGATTGQGLPQSLLQVFDRATMNPVATLHVTSDIMYGANLCRIVQNHVEQRVYVIETRGGEHNPSVHAQLYGFETLR